MEIHRCSDCCRQREIVSSVHVSATGVTEFFCRMCHDRAVEDFDVLDLRNGIGDRP
jgi:hypothetical protein